MTVKTKEVLSLIKELSKDFDVGMRIIPLGSIDSAVEALKSLLKERSELKRSVNYWKEESLRYHANSNYWRSRFESLSELKLSSDE